MINKIKIVASAMLLLFGKNTSAQTLSDTAAMVNDFSRVMSFTLQPYVFFTTVTKMSALPVIQDQDTMSFTGTFYKNEAALYYSNGQEQVYYQDSFMIQINQKRKSIWISKVDVASKEKMNVLPVNNKQLQELFSKKYTIKKTKLNDLISILNFEARKAADSTLTTSTGIKLEYRTNDFLPVLMEIEIRTQQPLTNEMLLELKNENIDDTRLVQVIGNTKYLIRSQTISVAFDNINKTKQKVIDMPSWKEALDYNEAQQEFIAKGLYKDYEVTKIF